jgi:predicted esterase
MLAEFFIRKFDALVDEDSAVIAPEGMHRFYLEGTSGRVGASWMTKDDRSVDIFDNMHYLNALMETIYEEAHPEASLFILGFSQGCPTAARYAMQARKLPGAFIGYASDIPLDTLDTLEKRKKWEKMKVCLAIGDNDPYIPVSRINPHLEELKQAVPHLLYISYTGDHRILSEPLHKIKKACLLT